MLPRLVIGQRNIDVEEYNAHFERKKKHLCCNSNNSFTYFCNYFLDLCGGGNNRILEDGESRKKCVSCKFSMFTAFFIIISVRWEIVGSVTKFTV